jgi:hypothetical protein
MPWLNSNYLSMRVTSTVGRAAATPAMNSEENILNLTEEKNKNEQGMSMSCHE